jgi:hypothetical protein
MEKTKITHIGSEFAKFLGHYIRSSTVTQNISISSRRKSIEGKLLPLNVNTNVNTNVNKSTGKPKILVPINSIKQKLIEHGFANEKGFPKYVGRLLFLSDYEIVHRYNSILRGLMNFYNMAENRYDLNELVYIIEYSLAHTLAAKHRLSLKQVFTKYGKPIRVKLPGLEKEKTVVFNKPLTLSAAYLNDKYARTTRFGKALASVDMDPLQYTTIQYTTIKTCVNSKNMCK